MSFEGLLESSMWLENAIICFHLRQKCMMLCRKESSFSVLSAHRFMVYEIIFILY